MKKVVIGYLYYDTRGLDTEDKFFFKQAKEKNIELVPIELSKEVDLIELQEKVKKCDLVLNDSIQGFAVEFVKTIEALGKKVIEDSKSYYYTQDKWILYLNCKKHNIPVPETILLSDKINIALKELKEFNHWPAILKKLDGTRGECVEKADNIRSAEKTIKKFWKNERFPLIAQEYIKSPSYRVTIMGNKIVQTALKENKSWKCTGVYANNIKKFKINKKLRETLKRLMKITKIKICGIDLLKKDNDWIILEINSEPAFDFFDNEEEMMVSKALDFLKKEALKH